MVNDRLDLILDPVAGESSVRWSVIAPIVDAMEALLLQGALALPTMRGPQFGGAPEPRAYLRLAGPPERGSIILPFAVELSPHFTLQFPGMTGGNSPLLDFLGNIADLAGLASFSRDFIFGERGALARRTDQAKRTPPADTQDAALDELENTLDRLTPAIDRLIQSAATSGLAQVSIRVNDQMAIDLIAASNRRRAVLLARRRQPEGQPGVGPGLAMYSLNLDNLTNMKLAAASELPVEFRGKPASAFLIRSATDLPRGMVPETVVAVWTAAKRPESKSFDAQSRRISSDDVTPLDDVPLEFEQAVAVVEVTGTRPAYYE